jgi:hypothetical protein
MQDSNDDWLREAKTMEKVYKNTYFNISADYSEDSAGGCFTERLAHKIAPCRYEAPGMGWLKFTCPDIFAQDLDFSALSERAWVVQERYMSPRVLHFAAHQLYWECAELFACETFVEGVPDVYDKRSSWHYRANSSLAPIHLRGKPNYYKIWERICMDYSKGKLTDLSDKLIAFSGIAREFQSRLPQDTYLAGIWKRNLVSGLLWQFSPPKGPKDDGSMPFGSASPTPIFRVPSWSWLSIDCGNISWSRRTWDPIIRVLETTIDLVNDGDPSGKMRGGSIVVRGRLRSAGWEHQDGRDLVVFDGKHGHGDSKGFRLASDTGSMFPVKDIFCLLAMRFDQSGLGPEVIIGLVLRSTAVKDTYQRLGFFSADGTLSCMALKYKLRPLAQEMKRPWDKLCFPPLVGEEKSGVPDSITVSDGSVEKDAEARPADAYTRDAPYDETLYERLEERTITLI